ncbi:hypothetical protein G9C98_001578 [Cotesia typhae]|uniref:Cytochrome P450 n=1 Tax=Cotesia typhae TaxID=2053667 RepID=A0A8J5V748_9HYME|nr:hypothetical protein G9C98_001578 [Cotesia typhae]
MILNALYVIFICLVTTLGTLFLTRSRDSPPGPYPWPIFGNLKLIRKLSRKFGGQHVAFMKLNQQYNSDVIKLWLGSSSVYVVGGFESIQKILRDDNYDARPWTEFIKVRNMGIKKGITMTDGPEWKAVRGWLVRSLRNLGFGREKMCNRISEELEILIDGLKRQEDKPVRMKSMIAPAVINGLWTLVTGKRIDDKRRLMDFLDIMERRAQAFDVTGGILSVFPWLRRIAPKACGYEVLVTLNNELKALLMETIEEHKKNYVKGSEKDLIDMFLTEMHLGDVFDAEFDDDQLLMILVDLFIAGSQTTTLTLDFLFLWMTVYQDAQAKLQDELDAVVGNRLPDLSDRPKLPFTEAVITESQRLRLVTPIIGPRRTLKEASFNGYRIPKGATILMNTYSVHADPNIFQDPLSFRPERFIQDNVYTPSKKLTFFGGGHRRCPGETVAKSEVFLLFAGIMKNFKLLPMCDNDLPDINPQPGLTISPKPYEVLLVKR